MNRCHWCNPNNPRYIAYHDLEWGQPNFDETYLLEMLILESFQAGLSWECVLNKREDFRKAFDDFQIDAICQYDDEKIQELLTNQNIIRNQRKIHAAIGNSRIFRDIQREFGSFSAYLQTFTRGKIFHETGKATNELSDNLSADLKKRGMKFVGSTIIYSFLQAIGVLYSHEEGCFLYREN